MIEQTQIDKHRYRLKINESLAGLCPGKRLIIGSGKEAKDYYIERVDGDYVFVNDFAPMEYKYKNR